MPAASFELVVFDCSLPHWLGLPLYLPRCVFFGCDPRHRLSPSKPQDEFSDRKPILCVLRSRIRPVACGRNLDGHWPVFRMSRLRRSVRCATALMCKFERSASGSMPVSRRPVKASPRSQPSSPMTWSKCAVRPIEPTFRCPDYVKSAIHLRLGAGASKLRSSTLAATAATCRSPRSDGRADAVADGALRACSRINARSDADHTTHPPPARRAIPAWRHRFDRSQGSWREPWR